MGQHGRNVLRFVQSFGLFHDVCIASCVCEWAVEVYLEVLVVLRACLYHVRRTEETVDDGSRARHSSLTLAALRGQRLCMPMTIKARTGAVVFS